MGFFDSVGELLRPVSNAGAGFRAYMGYGDTKALPPSLYGKALVAGGLGLAAAGGAAVVGAAPAGAMFGTARVGAAAAGAGLNLPSWMIPAGIGAGVGAVLFGGKSTTQQAAPQTINNQQYTINRNISNVYSPQITTNKQTTFAPNYNMISGSPGASISNSPWAGGSLSSNPSQAITPTQSATQTPSQTASQSQKQASGMDWATIAAIAGVALVAYGYTSRKGK